MDVFPCKARQVQPLTDYVFYYKTIFFVFIIWGSLAMSAGAYPTSFRPI
jgi:hypothetical protein